MTWERVKSMDQRSFWTSSTAEAAGQTVSAAHSFPGTRQNASVRTVTQVHMGNVGLMVLIPDTRLVSFWNERAPIWS
jgi:hypothetical protein